MTRSVVATYLLIFTCYALFVTQGTGEIFGPEWLSASYDSLASSLLQGEAHVDPAVISYEGLRRSGKTYMYFGPFPALIHMVINLVAPGHEGEVARVSCLLAAMLSICVFGAIVQRALRLNGSLQNRQRTIFAVLSITSFALGTPLLYLVSCARIFHEASLWGLCGGLLAVYGIVLICTAPQRAPLGRLLFSIALAVALLSRITFALPICLAAPLVFLWRVRSEAKSNQGILRVMLKRFAAMVPALIGIAIQLWYNNKRFGSPFTFFDYTTFYIIPRQIGGEFNAARIPIALKHYFGFSWAYFSDVPPYIQMANTEISRPEIFMRYWREQTISLSFASCSIMLLALLGLPALVRAKVPTLLLVYAGCLLSEVFAILSYFFITERYATDFLPLITVGVVASALTISYSRKLLVTLSVLSVVSIAVTILSTLDWNMALNGHAPDAFRRQLAKAFLPPLALPEGRERLYMSDMTPLQEGELRPGISFNRSARGNPLSWNGTGFEKGVGMEENRSIGFAVPTGFDRLQAIVSTAFESTHRNEASMVFQVTNERGDVLFRSATMRARSLPQTVDVPLGDSKSITLSLIGEQEGAHTDLGNWNAVSFVKSAR